MPQTMNRNRSITAFDAHSVARLAATVRRGVSAGTPPLGFVGSGSVLDNGFLGLRFPASGTVHLRRSRNVVSLSVNIHQPNY